MDKMIESMKSLSLIIISEIADDSQCEQKGEKSTIRGLIFIRVEIIYAN